MMIHSIRLQNFRSYGDDSYEFGSGVNIIVGPNASGKTNLLEALLVICQGASYRAQAIEFIQFHKDWARLTARVDQDERIVKLDAREARFKKTYEINNQALARLPLTKKVPVVLFEPGHLQLLTGSPELRRDYLDTILNQTVDGFEKLGRNYRRALAQRNALLKKGNTGQSSQLFAWNIRLSELGGQVAKYRGKLIIEINQRLASLYQKLSGDKATVVAEYLSACPIDRYENELLKRLEASTELDYLRGFTVYGPHRDDLQLRMNGHPLQEMASRGEVRTTLLALKLVELELIEQARQQKPILLLDDVFSELDGARRLALTKFLKNYQTFITTTDADIVVQHFMNNCTIIPTTR